MYTVFDYVKYYKDISLKSVGWNIMDNLVCAILVYLPINEFDSNVTLTELSNDIDRLKQNNDYSAVGPIALKLLNSLDNSKRYENMKVSNFVNIRNEETQFGVATFKINNNIIVSYKGTDGSLIGWLENFRISYSYLTYTQQLAVNYLSNLKVSYNSNIYVVGHSKGGNLAMASAMEASNRIFNKIVNIVNFDGPGFRKEEYLSDKFKRLSTKLINIVPTGSVVGILMNNNDYKVVKSSSIGINEHYPTSWNIFGGCFVEGNLSMASHQLHESSTTGIEEIDPNMLKESIETLFKTLGKKYTSNFKLTLEDIKVIYENMKSFNPKIYKYLSTILNSMLSVSYIKKEKLFKSNAKEVENENI